MNSTLSANTFGDLWRVWMRLLEILGMKCHLKLLRVLVIRVHQCTKSTEYVTPLGRNRMLMLERDVMICIRTRVRLRSMPEHEKERLPKPFGAFGESSNRRYLHLTPKRSASARLIFQ